MLTYTGSLVLLAEFTIWCSATEYPKQEPFSPNLNTGNRGSRLKASATDKNKHKQQNTDIFFQRKEMFWFNRVQTLTTYCHTAFFSCHGTFRMCGKLFKPNSQGLLMGRTCFFSKTRARGFWRRWRRQNITGRRLFCAGENFISRI